MVLGECICGSVAFEASTVISDVYMCHCSDCRMSTGNHGVAVVIVPKEEFRWLRGENYVTTWKKPTEDWMTSFCRICGSRLPGVNDETRMYIPAGVLTNGSEFLKVTHHFWVSSKVAWYEIGDSGIQYQRSF